MSQTPNIPQSQEVNLPPWMTNMVHPSNTFELEIQNKISPFPHYPGPIHSIGGLRVGSQCRVPGVQPLVQTFLRPKTCAPRCLTNFCYQYGNTRFPRSCACDDPKSHCHKYTNCNHNENVIHQ
jgi:hypothetical protein